MCFCMTIYKVECMIIATGEKFFKELAKKDDRHPHQ